MKNATATYDADKQEITITMGLFTAQWLTAMLNGRDDCRCLVDEINGTINDMFTEMADRDDLKEGDDNDDEF